MEIFDVSRDCLPHIKELRVCTSSDLVDINISRQICHWPNLHRVDCQHITLDMDAIMHLSTAPNLKQLWFTADMNAAQDILHLGSKLVFSSLADLYVTSKSLDTIALLLSHVQLPAIEKLTVVTFSNYVSR